eukprot:GHVH01003177.1.p1 GENE.GHVH01003177.1~~GHVH01003177.1.p1  ORF type:complete len:1694 (+),score=181.92 GHVH01003177.1:311-5083(+)
MPPLFPIYHHYPPVGNPHLMDGSNLPFMSNIAYPPSVPLPSPIQPIYCPPSYQQSIDYSDNPQNCFRVRQDYQHQIPNSTSPRKRSARDLNTVSPSFSIPSLNGFISVATLRLSYQRADSCEEMAGLFGVNNPNFDLENIQTVSRHHELGGGSDGCGGLQSGGDQFHDPYRSVTRDWVGCPVELCNKQLSHREAIACLKEESRMRFTATDAMWSDLGIRCDDIVFERLNAISARHFCRDIAMRKFHLRGKETNKEHHLFHSVLEVNFQDCSDTPNFTFDRQTIGSVASNTIDSWSELPPDYLCESVEVDGSLLWPGIKSASMEIVEVQGYINELFIQDKLGDVSACFDCLRFRLLPTITRLCALESPIPIIWKVIDLRVTRLMGSVFSRVLNSSSVHDQALILNKYMAVGLSLLGQCQMYCDELEIKQRIWQFGIDIVTNPPSSFDSLNGALDMFDIFFMVRDQCIFTGSFQRIVMAIEAIWITFVELSVIYCCVTNKRDKLLQIITCEDVPSTLGLGTWAVVINNALNMPGMLPIDLYAILFTANVHCSKNRICPSEFWLTACQQRDYKELLTLSITRIVCTRGIVRHGNLSYELVIGSATKYVNMYTEIIAEIHNKPFKLIDREVLLMCDNDGNFDVLQLPNIAKDYCCLACVDLSTKALTRLLIFYFGPIMTEPVGHRHRFRHHIDSVMMMLVHTKGWVDRDCDLMKIILSLNCLLNNETNVEFLWDDCVSRGYVDESFFNYMLDVSLLSPNCPKLPELMRNWINVHEFYSDSSANESEASTEGITTGSRGFGEQLGPTLLTKLSSVDRRRSSMSSDELMRCVALPVFLKLMDNPSGFVNNTGGIRNFYPYINPQVDFPGEGIAVDLTIAESQRLWKEVEACLIPLIDLRQNEKWASILRSLNVKLSSVNSPQQLLYLVDGSMEFGNLHLFQVLTRPAIENMITDSVYCSRSNQETQNPVSVLYDLLTSMFDNLCRPEVLNDYVAVMIGNLRDPLLVMTTNAKRFNSLLPAVRAILEWYWKRPLGLKAGEIAEDRAFDDLSRLVNGLLVNAAVSANYVGMLQLLEMGCSGDTGLPPDQKITWRSADAASIPVYPDTINEIVKHLRREGYPKREDKKPVDARKREDDKTQYVWKWLLSYDFNLDGNILLSMVESAVRMDEQSPIFKMVLHNFRAAKTSVTSRSAAGLIKLYGRLKNWQLVYDMWDIISAQHNALNQLAPPVSLKSSERVDLSKISTTVDGFDFRGVVLNANLYTAVFDAMVTSDKMNSALQCFEQLRVHAHHDPLNVPIKTIHYSILIKGLIKANYLQNVIDLYLDMIHHNVSFSSVTFNNLIHKLVLNKQMEKALALLMEVKAESSFTPDVVTYSTLIRGFCESSQMTDAIQVFRMMTSEGTTGDIVCYNTLLDGAVRHSRHDIVREIVSRVTQKSSDIKPTAVTLTILTRWYDKNGGFKNILKYYREWPREYAFKVDLQLYTAVISSCLNHNATSEAVKTFNEIPFPIQQKLSSRFYGTLVRGLLNGNRGFDAVMIAEKSLRINQEVHYNSRLKMRLRRYISSERLRCKKLQESGMPEPLDAESMKILMICDSMIS